MVKAVEKLLGDPENSRDEAELREKMASEELTDEQGGEWFWKIGDFFVAGRVLPCRWG